MPEQHFPSATVRPFSFRKGWETSSQVFPRVNFAEQQANQCVKFAAFFARSRAVGASRQMMKKAKWWRQIAAQPQGEPQAYDSLTYLAALESVGVLLTRAKQGSNEAALHLAELFETIVSNLCSLVVHEDAVSSGQAAAALVKSLSKAVSAFETLAKCKPTSLLPETRSALSIPGFISPASEKVRDNAELVSQLEVGTESLFFLSSTTKSGKTMKLVTGTNLWAARLIGYLLTVRAEIDQTNHLRAKYEKGMKLGNDAISDFFLRLQAPERLGDEYSPGWLQAASDLKPFSLESCQSWFEVAWMVVSDVTHGEPEKEPALFEIGKSGADKPVGYRSEPLKGTKTSNVRGVIRARLRKAFGVLATRRSAPNKDNGAAKKDS